jgi:N-carbamoyl-D-amino-acid hydrolase
MTKPLFTSRKLGLAVGQMGPVLPEDSRESVVARLVEMLREAKSRGAQLVMFPELALTTFFPRYWMDEAQAVERYFEREMPNGRVQPLFDTARELGIGFYLGYAELTPEGRRFNTCILVDRQARIVGKYRKIHLPGGTQHQPDSPFQSLEKKYFEVGDLGFPVWQEQGATIGMCLCNDRRWPETYRVMAMQNAELILIGYNTRYYNTDWEEPQHLRMFHHLISLQANAYQNATWVAAAGKAGVEDGYHMIAGSVIVAPTGEIVAQTVSEDDEVITSHIDLGWCDNYKKYVFNFGKHRRPEHYGLIVERAGVLPPQVHP